MYNEQSIYFNYFALKNNNINLIVYDSIDNKIL